MGMTYNPAQVLLGGGKGPYLPTEGSPILAKNPPPMQAQPTLSGAPATRTMPTPPTAAPPATNILAPENIRATGTGPFDSAYRQNLATYAGGQFSRPGGSMNFNPTDPNTFPGQPTGGGTAPVAGMPNSLMDMALGGQGFSWTPPPPANTAQSPGDFQTMQQWMNQFLMNGRNGRMGAIV